MEVGKRPNRLIHEKSPYLLQHAFNPVDWYPWGDEAFEKARKEQKVIFLSIGYSTCHWCHVMERESFENDSIAAAMNRYFICIKVDREERPDVDKVYMTALQAMGQGGGWPMSMFLTPDLKPFFGGTYFPPNAMHGRPGFPDVLQRIHEIWQNDRQKILESADGLTKFLKELPISPQATGSISAKMLDSCFQQAEAQYDPKYGGFGGGPKFPRPVVFNFLLRYYERTGNKIALAMSENTLRKMSLGGMYDHIGGGFHRYSVDGEWRVPHFEKMLYDQAQLVFSYVDIYKITKDRYFESVVRDVLKYVSKDMTAPTGGFYSAEDADSEDPDQPGEKGEGSFYVWEKKEVLEILGDKRGELFSYYFGIEEKGNALQDPQQEFLRKNILYVAHTAAQTAGKFGKDEGDVAGILNECRETLAAKRADRLRPHLDDKILTSWNGLMISAYARAHQTFGDPEYLRQAERAASFILEKLYDKNSGLLLRRYRDGEAKLEAHLEDYSFFVQGLLDLYETSFDVRWLQEAIRLTKTANDIFWDKEHGGYFDTSGKDPSVLVRMKEQYDGAEPTGNSIAAMNLLRLSEMADNADWRTKAEKTLSLFSTVLEKHSFTVPQMMAAVDFSLGAPLQAIVVGAHDKKETQAILREINGRYIPNKVVLLVDPAMGDVSAILPFAAKLSMVEGKSTAYLCEDYVCKLPATDVATVVGLLEGRNGKH